MKKLVTALALIALSSNALATPTTVGDFRGTVQTDTTTGVHTITLNSDTTIVRLNASSLSEVVGMTGGVDGRMVFFWNIGSANSLFYTENTNATSTDRFVMDVAAGGFRYLFNSGLGLGMAIYDGTTSRWRFSTWEGSNGTGSLTVNGDLSTTGSAIVTGGLTAGDTTVAASDSVRLKLKALSSSNNGSTLRWQNSSASSLFSMGPDYNGNQGLDFWLYDNSNSITNLYIKNTGISYLSMGTSAGGIQYDESRDETSLFAGGQIRLKIAGLAGGAIKLNAPLIFRRQASGTAKPTLDSATCGASASWLLADSNDSRGAFTMASGKSSCKMTFTIPWDVSDDNSNQGQPVCTANTSDSAKYVAITSSGDHDVTFTPSSSTGTTTIYYHCDGVAPPTL